MNAHAGERTEIQEFPQSRWLAMAVLLAAGFMNLIDVTIVNVAIPSLQRDLAATSSQIEWVVAAYILAFALGLLPFGRLGDTIGRRLMFLLGVAAFTVASTLCGLAPNIETLIAARVLQGVAGAMMSPQTLAIAQVIFPPAERGAAFALFGLAAGLAAVTGPVVGGLLIDANFYGLEWRPIFLVNIPFGVLAIFAGLRYIPPMRGERALGIDWTGILLAGATVLLAVYPLIEGRELGWPAWCFWMMAASVPMAALFVRWQIAQSRRKAPQLLPAALMANRNFMAGTLISTTFFSAVPSFFFILAIYLQVGYGLRPIESGLATLPFSVGVLVSSLVSGRLGLRHQRLRMAVGAAMLVCSMLWLRTMAGGMEPGFAHLTLLPPLLIGGLGLGSTVSPMFQTTLATVPGRDAGSASGGLQAFQQVGGAVGVAIVGQLFFSRLQSAMASGSVPSEAFNSALQLSIIYAAAAFSVVLFAAYFIRSTTAQVGIAPVTAPPAVE